MCCNVRSVDRQFSDQKNCSQFIPSQKVCTRHQKLMDGRVTRNKQYEYGIFTLLFMQI